jgi:hypothetical protein
LVESSLALAPLALLPTRINWGDGPAESVPLDPEGGEAGPSLVASQDPDSMLEPPPTSSFKDVHSMDESSNVEMEMAF